MSLDVMKIIYYSYVHSVISYGIIFWGNSHLSDNIFKIQKIIIRISMFHHAFFNSIIDKHQNTYFFIQHYISLEC